jgi:hypothetical protein
MLSVQQCLRSIARERKLAELKLMARRERAFRLAIERTWYAS